MRPAPCCRSDRHAERQPGQPAARADGMRTAGLCSPASLPGVYTVTVFLNGFDEAAVTATRIEEPLPQVPMSLSAVTGADIERRAIGNLTELSRWTPGLTVVDQGARGSNVVIVRGSVATFGITRESPLGGPRYTANPNTLWIRRV